MQDLIDGLPADTIRRFIDDGAIPLPDAFSADLAARCRARLWADAGLSPGRPDQWTEAVVRLGPSTDPDLVAAANGPRLHAAFDALCGPGRWLPPAAMGSFALRFPDRPGMAPAPDTGWHVDMSFGTQAPDFMDWRVNVTSRGRALLMLVLFTDTGPEDAPTRLRLGSHRRIARRLLPAGDAGLTLRDLAADGFERTADLPEAAATGAAGTVWLCHPFLVHAAQDHRGTAPRFLAQPPLLPAHPFDPALPPSPVQTAIREACGL